MRHSKSPGRGYVSSTWLLGWHSYQGLQLVRAVFLVVKEFENSLRTTLLAFLNKHLMPLNKHMLLMLWDAIRLM